MVTNPSDDKSVLDQWNLSFIKSQPGNRADCPRRKEKQRYVYRLGVRLSCLATHVTNAIPERLSLHSDGWQM